MPPKRKHSPVDLASSTPSAEPPLPAPSTSRSPRPRSTSVATASSSDSADRLIDVINRRRQKFVKPKRRRIDEDTIPTGEAPTEPTELEQEAAPLAGDELPRMEISSLPDATDTELIADHIPNSQPISTLSPQTLTSQDISPFDSPHPSPPPSQLDLPIEPYTAASASTEPEPLSAYTCPICFSPPSYAVLTPCGHICCSECLFVAVRTTLQRAVMHMTPERPVARCPVCRAVLKGWDGRGGGVIGLQPRAVFSL